MNSATTAAVLLLPRQWRNWVFVGIGYSMLFVITLSQIPGMEGTAPAFTMIDGSPVLVGYRMTVWSWLVLAGILWHFTVGTWRARLATARQRQHGYAPGEAPIAIAAARGVQTAWLLSEPAYGPAPAAPLAATPAALSTPPADTAQSAPTVKVPQLIIPTVLGSGRTAQRVEDRGTFTVVDRRRFVIDER